MPGSPEAIISRGMGTDLLTGRPRGRPAIAYDPAIAEEICIRIATSNKGLKAICDEDRALPEGQRELVDYQIAYKWLNSNADFQEGYAHAKRQQAEILYEEMMQIADESEGDAELAYNKDGSVYARMNGRNVQRSKLMVEQRRWAAAKLNPRVYGDKLDVTSGGEPLPAVSPVQIDARVQTIMLLANERRRIEEEARDLLEE